MQTKKLLILVDLLGKTDYNTKITHIENKYITTADCNKSSKNIGDNSIKIKNLVDKSAIAGFINNTDVDKKAATLATKSELKGEQAK